MALQQFSFLELENILKKSLSIPSYQREYTWDRDQWDDLWQDLLLTEQQDDSYKHFFGQIVVHCDRSRFDIIDGQQRITTSVILLSVLIHKLYDLKDENNNDLLIRIIIGFEGILGARVNFQDDYRNYTLSFSQNARDNEYFRKIIHRDNTTITQKSKVTSQENMRRCAIYLNKKVEEMTKDLSKENARKIIERLINIFKSRFNLMYIEATELSEAFTIFETLNARGRDLASADLLKNYLFSKAAQNIDALNEQWVRILDTLDGIPMTKFIKAYWSTTHNLVREKHLYKIIASTIKNGNASIEFLNKLEDLSGFYHDLCQPNEQRVITNAELIQSLKGLSTLKTSTFYPVLLSMYAKRLGDDQAFSFEDIAQVSLTIESFVFKNIVICGNNPNSSEVLFAKISQQITNGTLSTVSDIKKSINSNLEPEEQLKLSFINLNFEDKKEAVRYFFRKLHRHLDNIHEINLENSLVHIEHIMPINAEKWTDITQETHDKYLRKIGNLCLLSGQLNIEISNSIFSNKKEVAYSVSHIKPNNDICEYEIWNEISIEDRTLKLYKRLIEIRN